MKRVTEFLRSTPFAFWLALLGVAYSVFVFYSGVFKEMSGFALIFMVPGFLTVAILTGLNRPAARAVGAAISALMALLFAILVVVFANEPANAEPKTPQTVILVHAASMLIAGGAAFSAFLAAKRGAVRAAALGGHVFGPAIGLVIGAVAGYALASLIQLGAGLGVSVGGVVGLICGIAVDAVRTRRSRLQLGGGGGR